MYHTLFHSVLTTLWHRVRHSTRRFGLVGRNSLSGAMPLGLLRCDSLEHSRQEGLPRRDSLERSRQNGMFRCNSLERSRSEFPEWASTSTPLALDDDAGPLISSPVRVELGQQVVTRTFSLCDQKENATPLAAYSFGVRQSEGATQCVTASLPLGSQPQGDTMRIAPASARHVPRSVHHESTNSASILEIYVSPRELDEDVSCGCQKSGCLKLYCGAS